MNKTLENKTLGSDSLENGKQNYDISSNNYKNMDNTNENGQNSVATSAKIYKFTITDSEHKFDCVDYGTYEQMAKLFGKTKVQIETMFTDYNNLVDRQVDFRPKENYLFIRYYDINGFRLDIEVDDIPMYDEDDDFGETIDDYFKEINR